MQTTSTGSSASQGEVDRSGSNTCPSPSSYQNKESLNYGLTLLPKKTRSKSWAGANATISLSDAISDVASENNSLVTRYTLLLHHSTHTHKTGRQNSIGQGEIKSFSLVYDQPLVARAPVFKIKLAFREFLRIKVNNHNTRSFPDFVCMHLNQQH